MKTNVIYLSDNLAKLRELPDNSVDTIITDSPYGLGDPPDPLKVLAAWITVGYYEVSGKGFMGKVWDRFVPQPILWKECLRVLKPGGYLLSFFGTRTYDWGAMAIRIAGFEIRDQIDWIYGSGFPKSKQSLKPGHEPICVARKPGPLRPLNIDDGRIELNGDHKGGLANRTKGIGEPQNEVVYGKALRSIHDDSKGRWPSNVIIDEESAIELDEQSGITKSNPRPRVEVSGNSTKSKTGGFGIQGGRPVGFITPSYDDIGGSSRFFYVAKASPSERNGSKHPTIKPLNLMRQLVRIYVPIGGVCLDCHVGSGPTVEACILEGRPYIGIDNDPQSIDDTQKRINKHNTLFTKSVAD